MPTQPPYSVDELPRPLRQMGWLEDLWGPFVHTAGALMIAFIPAFLAWRSPTLPQTISYPLTAIMAFCYAYRSGIMWEMREVGADPDLKRWTMDISDAALAETFHHWGDRGEEIEVYCDESKPLRASAEKMRDLAMNGIPKELRAGYPGHFPERPPLLGPA